MGLIHVAQVLGDIDRIGVSALDGIREVEICPYTDSRGRPVAVHLLVHRSVQAGSGSA